jgi:hypothetical protein
MRSAWVTAPRRAPRTSAPCTHVGGRGHARDVGHPAWIARTHLDDADYAAAWDCLEAAVAVADATPGDVAAAGHATNVQAVVPLAAGRLDEAERLYLNARTAALQAGDAKLAAMTRRTWACWPACAATWTSPAGTTRRAWSSTARSACCATSAWR